MKTLAAITVTRIAAHCVQTSAVTHTRLALVHICNGGKRNMNTQGSLVNHLVTCQTLGGKTGTINESLTVAGFGSEVIFKSRGTLALVHARRVDTFSRFSADAGKHETFIDIWKTEN